MMQNFRKFSNVEKLSEIFIQSFSQKFHEYLTIRVSFPSVFPMQLVMGVAEFK